MRYTLLTGGAGFIGTNLCIKILSEGRYVIAVDNMIGSDGKAMQRISNKRFVFVKHDITLPFPKKILNKDIEEIYHLACPTGVPNVVKLAEEMLKACSIGTFNVMELAKATNSRVVLTSSSEVYGDPEIFPQSEKYTGNVDPRGIRSPYEEGKRFSESVIMMYMRKYGVDAKIVRVFNTYGPHMSMNDSRVIPNFVKQLTNGEPLCVQGDGSQRRTFCYIDDLIEGLLLVMKQGESGEVYNLGGDEEVSILELAKSMLKLSGAKNEIEFVERPEHDHKSRRPDVSKVKGLGWRQRVGLEEGLKKTMEWYEILPDRKLFA